MSSQDRSSIIKSFTNQVFDVLIIGGGIVGAGAARDAALRGLKVALVEQHDFAAGTSSRSSRLLHGGLRYLAQGRIGLVHEASVEKKVIHHIAPHLADPLPFIFPTYRNNKDWVLWQLKIGVKIYDLLCGGRNLGKSTWHSREDTVRMVPAILGDKLKGSVRYYDGLTNDARLTIDSLRSAARAGAVVLNYCKFTDAQRTGTWDSKVQDVLSGNTFNVKSRTVINATGPWADGLPHSRVKLRATKGIHLVVDRSRVPVPDTVVMTEGKRILFAIPWGERTILGTTDTDYSGAPEDVRTDKADIDYVLKITNQFFPAAKLGQKDVISFWAGLRPLIANPNGKPSDISRSHEIRNPEPGWWDVAGGKLTTYRRMAEQVVDRILREQKIKALPCRTASEPLLPVEETRGISSILPPEFSRAAVDHFVAKEWAVRLDDVMLRRSSWHYYSKDAAQMASRVAEWMSELLGWSPGQKAAELAHYQAETQTGAPAKAQSMQPSR
jgi:glycerol-3-phosphate dehydrogenase